MTMQNFSEFCIICFSNWPQNLGETWQQWAWTWTLGHWTVVGENAVSSVSDNKGLNDNKKTV